MDFATHARVGALLDAGRPFAIATVVAVHGSASAPPGSCALIDASGTNVFGWVGGGCAERFVCEQAALAIEAARARKVEVDLDDEIFGVGMPCGGRMEVFIEPVLPEPPLVVVGHDPVAHAIAQLAAQVGWRVTGPTDNPGATAPSSALEVRVGECGVVATRHAPGEAIEAPPGLDLGGRTTPEIALAVVAGLEARRHIASAAPLQSTRGAGPLGVLPTGWGPPELVIVGHSRICEALSALGVWLGWTVSVDGPPVDAMDRYPGARRVEPSADFATLPASPVTAVIVAAHHKGDHDAIAAAIRRGAPYVGLIASGHRSGLVRSMVLQRGVPEADLARLRAPAGLDLGGRSPTAIALSVMAEVLAVHHGRGHGAAAGWPRP